MRPLLTPWSHWIPPPGERYGPGKHSFHGRGGYQVMLRSCLDPERRPRGEQDLAEKLATNQAVKLADDPMKFRDAILGVVDDGNPRTLNAIGVLVMDKTADILGGTPFEECVWQMVATGELEACTEAADGCGLILFRQRMLQPGEHDYKRGGKVRVIRPLRNMSGCWRYLCERPDGERFEQNHHALAPQLKAPKEEDDAQG